MVIKEDSRWAGKPANGSATYSPRESA